VPIEIEAKMRLNDVASIQAALEQAGAKHELDLLEINTFFDTSQGVLKTSDQGLRIRVEQQVDGPHHAVIITHKGPRAHGKLKSRSETELIVDNARDAAELLGTIGFTPVMSFEKRRARWQLDDCVIAVDQLPYLGAFIEIEGPTEQSVLATRERLGLAESPLIRSSYIAMLRTYLADHDLHLTHVTFDTAAAGAS
jgi:adenylate cyclase class 2